MALKLLAMSCASALCAGSLLQQTMEMQPLPLWL
jgi:hypothetical protein